MVQGMAIRIPKAAGRPKRKSNYHHEMRPHQHCLIEGFLPLAPVQVAATLPAHTTFTCRCSHLELQIPKMKFIPKVEHPSMYFHWQRTTYPVPVQSMRCGACTEYGVPASI